MAPNRISRRARRQDGFTLVELVVVIALIAIMTTFFATRSNTALGWKKKGEIRAFINTWEFLQREAPRRGEAYRLVVNLDSQMFNVRREVPIEEDYTGVRRVDRLQGMRLESEKDRVQQKEDERILSVQEEFKEEDDRQRRPLEELFFESFYSDPEARKRLAIPLEFPSLQKDQPLSEGLRIRGIKVGSEYFTSGVIPLRFSPRGATSFGVVHFDLDGQLMTAVLDPVSGQTKLVPGEIDVDWKPVGQSSSSGILDSRDDNASNR